MNKRILISVSTIAAVSAMAVGGTLALFSDTETSQGNIFTAGAIDLKVDHQSSTYNDVPCSENCVEDTQTQLLANGGFEVPDVNTAQNWQIFPNGTGGLGWTVGWEAGQPTTFNSQNQPTPALVEYHEGVMAGWNAFEGDQYAELDTDWDGPTGSLTGEPALAHIYQMVPTDAGKQYKVHYAYSPRPDVANAADNELKLRINGVQVANHSAAGNGSSTTWTAYEYTFAGTGSPVKVEFAAGGTANSLGVFLDGVRVHPMNCTFVQTAGTCTLWPEKDLIQGDTFWNFTDVKPGDRGTNLISLHVDSNDAFVCMSVENTQDNENTLVDPEVTAGDVTAGVPAGTDGGELSNYLKAIVWAEDNNDGVHQNTEAILYNGLLRDLSTDTLTLPTTTTDYLGLAWCAGTQTVNGDGSITCDGTGDQNVAQTDSFVADVLFTAVQQRNNGDFTCNPEEVTRIEVDNLEE